MFLVPDPEIGERVKLLDFGIAKHASLDSSGSRTRTGLVMGTPVYMSPEQCRGSGTLDHRADLYSRGCMLYELVAGRPPFVADGAGDIIAHHLYFQPEPVSNHERSVPEPFERLIMSLLDKDPGTRPRERRAGGRHPRWLEDMERGIDIQISDINRDDRPDLVVLSRLGNTGNAVNTISVVLNTTPTRGALRFAARLDFSTSLSGPLQLAIHDLDQDGMNDMILGYEIIGAETRPPADLEVLRNTTSAGATTVTFMPGTIDDTVFPTAVRDLDGDGKPDLVSHHRSIGSILVRVNTTTAPGLPSFGPKIPFTTTAYGVHAVGDLSVI